MQTAQYTSGPLCGLLDPATLKPHPITKNLPRWEDDDPRFLTLCDDVRDHGIRVPLLVTQDNHIVDGVLRWRAAKRRQLKEVPCEIGSDDTAATTVIRMLSMRKHYSLSAVAYLTYPLMQAALDERKIRQSKYPVKAASPSRGLVVLTCDAVAESLGISRSLFFYAKELHEILAEHEDLRVQFEHSILEQYKGLGSIVAGLSYLIKGAKGGGGEKPPTRQLELFTEGLQTFETRMSFWGKFELAQKEEAVKAIRKTVLSMPDDLVVEWDRAIKLRRRQAQEAA